MSGSSYFRVYAVGICCASVCTALSDEEAAARLDAEHPTGLTNGWFVSNDERFSGGEPNPCPCPDDTRCRHILFNC